MAASSGLIRLRLLFDYPPPSTTGCRMCWLLVDLSACRVVADLESVIREKFGFSRRSIFHLFVEEFYLPHTESIYVVRDNDSVRVKVECATQVNGFNSSPGATKCKKRCRDLGENGQDNDRERMKKKKRKKKISCEGSTTKLAAAEEEHKRRKRKKKMAENNRVSPQPGPKPAAAPPELPVKGGPPAAAKPELPVKGGPHGKPRGTWQKPSSSDSSSSDEDGVSLKTSSSSLLAHKPGSKPTQKNPVSSSSTDASSSDETRTVKIPPSSRPVAPTTITSDPHQDALGEKNQSAGVAALPYDKVTETQNHDSEEEIQLVVHRPQQPLQGRGGRDGPAERGRSVSSQRGFMSSCDGDQDESEVLQNSSDCVPKQDYSCFPLLAAPPPVGQKIAFKLLELTENYSPEVSAYKEGKILSFDPTTKQIELELLSTSPAPVEPGKFDLVYQNPDGSESVEYAISRGCWVMERWESLLEPRLII